jgi:hypothetical protein
MRETVDSLTPTARAKAALLRPSRVADRSAALVSTAEAAFESEALDAAANAMFALLCFCSKNIIKNLLLQAKCGGHRAATVESQPKLN